MFARSIVMGNSRASKSGTGYKYGSHAFLIYTINANEWARRHKSQFSNENILTNGKILMACEMHDFYNHAVNSPNSVIRSISRSGTGSV